MKRLVLHKRLIYLKRARFFDQFLYFFLNLLNFFIFKRVKSFKFQQFNSVFGENTLMFDSYNNLTPSGAEFCLSDDIEQKSGISKSGADEFTQNPPNDTVLYMCATIWHENNTEMMQLLKSIMRFE